MFINSPFYALACLITWLSFIRIRHNGWRGHKHLNSLHSGEYIRHMPMLIILVNVELTSLNIDLCAVYGHGNIGVINCFSQDTMSACRCNWAINVVDWGPRDTAAGRQDTGLPNTPGSQSNSTVVPSPLMGNATPAIFRSSFQALRSAWRVNRGHRKSSKHHLQMVQAWICGNTG